MLEKYNLLVNYFKPYADSGICIAYSGGVDSTLLLKAATDAVSSRTSNLPAPVRPVLAVILETQLHPHSDTEQACRMAKSLGAVCKVLQINEFQDPQILSNPKNRCYLCKHFLFTQLKNYAHSQSYTRLFDGTNKDDEKEYRPGRQALAELQIKSPLLELGITKAEVRELSRLQNLSTAFVPSTPCLATRLPYGTRLDQQLLLRIHQGELFLRQNGFYNVRLRYHAPVLRIEVDLDSLEEIIKKRAEILSALKALQFPYITLDLEGFRSGSMDISLPFANIP